MTMAILKNIDFHGRDSGCSLLFLFGQTITLFYVAFPAFIITLHGHICNAKPPYMCNRAFSYTNGSNFECNLNTVLNSLVASTFKTGYNTSVYGEFPAQIYGLLQCSGNATTQECLNCSQKAISTIRQICGNAIGGRVWLEDCYLRYENWNFIGQLDYSVKYRYNQQNVSCPSIFNTALDTLFNSLSREATSGSGYASGTTVDSLSRKIYGLVQCWKDISSDDCQKCLSFAVNNIVTYYAGSQGVEGFLGSCKARYEIYSFFHSTAPPPSPAQAPAPAPAPKQITPSSDSNITRMNQSPKPSNKMPIIIELATGLLLVLFM